MDIDLKTVPYSRYGSYLAFSHLPKSKARPEGLYLRDVHGPALGSRPLQEILAIQLVQEGQPIPFQEKASPTLLRLEAETGYAEICLPEPHLIRIKSSNVGVRLSMETTAYDHIIPRAGGRWQVTCFSAVAVKLMLTPLRGQILVDAPWAGLKSAYVTIDLCPSESKEGDWAIESFTKTWQGDANHKSFAICVETVEREYRAWQAKAPQVPDAYARANELANYIHWSCVVEPQGHLTRPAMYMSKNWMLGVWSWDNCFNALALANSQPELAWHQFMLPFDHQDESGLLPDLVNDRLISTSFCKPPIQGWTLQRMIDHTTVVSHERLLEVYEPLCRWTEWWFTHRDDDGDGIPQYNHGNDSGWDNATVFDVRPPIESPDLSAYLVLQMDTLSRIAQSLGDEKAAQSWQTRADDLLQRLTSHFWRENRFVALQSGTHQIIESNSLFLFLPIILGQRLPKKIQTHLAAVLKVRGEFLTPHGLASERVTSPLYQPDGYWRGPIWGAPTQLIIDGLAATGEKDFAQELARRFCQLVAQHGLAENYDALTGAGLRDRAYSWTASVFLTLARDLQNATHPPADPKNGTSRGSIAPGRGK